MVFRLEKRRILNITVLWKPANFVAWQKNGYWVMEWISGVVVWKPGWTVYMSEILSTIVSFRYMTGSGISLLTGTPTSRFLYFIFSLIFSFWIHPFIMYVFVTSNTVTIMPFMPWSLLCRPFPSRWNWFNINSITLLGLIFQTSINCRRDHK